MPIATSTLIIAFVAILAFVSVATVYPSVMTHFFPSCGNGTACGTYGVATCNQVSGYNCACTTPVWGPGGRNTPCTTCQCMHNGTCVNDICVCPQGTSGNLCQIVADNCLSSPCQNGGNCTSGVSAYSCSCPSGFVGSQCQIPNQCASSPCSNGGTCVANVTTGNYTCVCAPGFTGPFCEININECASSPCRNGGACVDGINNYTCTCTAGFTGTTCQTSTQPGCGSCPCTNGATCVSGGGGSFTCTCAAGFSGQICQTNTNECNSSPCSNNGTCVDGANSFTCTCAAGYTGVNCENNIEKCASSPCSNGATCVDGVNSYTCTCVAGFTGANCQSDINECSSSPCSNGGVCVNGINGFTCTCAGGFTGTECQTSTQPGCGSSPCTNGATCHDGVNSFTCTCALGFTGLRCQSSLGECSSNPCTNGATCTDGIGNFTCLCAGGFFGAICQSNINDCVSNPCTNGGSCIDGISSYTCTCAAGYTGSRCQSEINECASSPCANGGTCTDGLNSFTCACASGFTGATCQNSVPAITCYNGGTQIDPTTCNCTGTGFAGPQCEFDLGPCGSNVYCAAGQKCQTNVIFNPASLPVYYNSSAPPVLPNQFFPGQCVVNTTGCPDNSTSVYSGYGGPGGAQVQVCNVFCTFGGSNPTCQNGGTCTTSGYNSFICTCPAGTTGYACQLLMCGSHLCQNNATCASGQCVCMRGFAGTNCEYDIGDCGTETCAESEVCQVLVDSNGVLTEIGCVTSPTCGSYNSLEVTQFNQTATNPPTQLCSLLCDNCITAGTASCVATTSSVSPLLGFQCTCLPGFGGSTCSNSTCSGVTCQNGGTCTAGVCTCADPWGGTHCEYNIAGCFGTSACTVAQTCAVYWQSPTFATQIGCSGCVSPAVTITGSPYNIAICNAVCSTIEPCSNGGTCVSVGINGYLCFCPLGYGGSGCEIAPPA